MAIITISGETGCRPEELAKLTAQRLRFELVTENRFDDLIRDEFGDAEIPDRAWQAAITSVLTRLATEHHLVVLARGAELLFPNFRGVLRAFVVAKEAYRVGNLMLDRHVDRAAAVELLGQLELAERQARRKRFHKPAPAAQNFDLVLNAETLEPEMMTEVVETAVAARRLPEHGLLSLAAEAQHQFQIRLQLARHGIVPAGKASLKHKPFSHPSEELFANLLDFYRIAWEYEPRSFPLQWDKEGKVTEAFTPDFYLPQFDLYVELTTMKQALVTRKNHKVRLLRAIYPHVNIQVFYQKDFQDLVSKYGLTERVHPV
jgi:cytidylate kinase